MFPINQLMLLMIRDRHLIKAPYGLKVTGVIAAGTTCITVAVGPEVVQAILMLKVTGSITIVAILGAEAIGNNFLICGCADA